VRTNRILFSLLALALVGLGRPVAGAAEGTVAVDTTRADVVQVRVVNNNWLDMRIYAVVDDFRVRLGTVTGLSSETLTLRPGLLGPSAQVQLQAVAIGNRFASDVEDVVMFPGDKFEYRIENAVALSFVRRI
jgi:hypothetical protein